MKEFLVERYRGPFPDEKASASLADFPRQT
jgi:hypothetical protein